MSLGKRIQGRAIIGLRQGMPVSPMLSNLLLKRFDEGLDKQGIVAVRYADDIAVFARSREECLEALAAVHLAILGVEPFNKSLELVGRGSRRKLVA
jgi:hypothetical protein